MGPATSKKPRSVMIQFAFQSDRDTVWSAKKELKGSSLYLREDVSKETSKYRATLIPILKAAKQNNSKATISGDTIIIDGQKYAKGQLDKLPESLNPTTLSTRFNEECLAFYGGINPLSNFYECNFEVAGIKYTSVEQYYQSIKAEQHGDIAAKNKILRAVHPADQKRLGTSVTVNEGSWSRQAPEIMHIGVKAKFEQNSELRNYLLETGSKTLLEASPRDTFWGTGVPLTHRNVLAEETHKGQNVLGRILMSVREQIRTNMAAETPVKPFFPPNFFTSPIALDKDTPQL
jgi:hypothetical protein